MTRLTSHSGTKYVNEHWENNAYLSGGWGRLPMILPFCGRGLCLQADVSFADLEAQFIRQILSQVAHLPVLESKSQKEKLEKKCNTFFSFLFFFFTDFEVNCFEDTML